MSAQTNAPLPPFNQWQNFYPSQGPAGYGYDQPASINDQIYATVMGNAERAKQLSDSQIYAAVTGNAEQTKQQAANDIARDILRAVDQNGATNSHITQLTGSGLQTAIERNGANGTQTTERVHAELAKAIERTGATNGHITELSSAQLATAIERNGANGMSTTERVNSQLASAVERNGSSNMAAIERTSGESRLTTVIADAANRQAANDATRDVLRTLDRVGSEAVTSTKDSFATLLGTSERIAGENRIQTLTSSGILDNSLRDVRHSILTDINRGITDVLSASTQSLNVLTKHVTDSAWEQRSALASGFQNISEGYLKTKYDLSEKMGDHYSSLMLENQKLGHFMSAKADGHFAANQLEMQKVKEGLACQAAQNFSITQLEAQKNREAIQMQLADAKYAALQSQQYLSDKMSECCCEIKQKIDEVDRDRLRDDLIVNRDENALLKFAEHSNRFGGWGRGGDNYFYNGRGDYYGRDDHHGGHHHGGDRDRRGGDRR